MTKNGRQFFGSRVTLSVAAPGDTNPSDATVTRVNILAFRNKEINPRL